jgi:hypothetical protein
MSRLPIPGQDDDTWGDILNNYLSQSLNADGTLKTSAVSASGAEQTANKGVANGYAGLDGSTKLPLALLPATTLSSASDVNISSPTNNQGLIYNSGTSKWTNQALPSAPVTSVAGKTGAVTLVEGDVASLTGDLNATEKTANKDVANGYAGLDGSGLLKAAELPSSAVTSSRLTGLRSSLLLGFSPTTPAGAVDAAALASFSATIAPRAVDIGMWYNSFPGSPLFSGDYTFLNGTAQGIIPLVDWQPHTTLGSVTGGSDDSQIITAALDCATYSKPILMRLAAEFNGNWNNYGSTKETAAQFVAGWQYVVNLFRAHGATNVLWVWNPNIFLSGGANTIDPTVPDGSGVNWYPGDSYVDFTGLDGYMTTEQPSVRQFYDLFVGSGNYASLTTLTQKPIMIAEFGVAADSRLAASGGKAGWYNAAFDTIRDYMPRLVALGAWVRATSPDDYSLNSSGSDTAAQTAFVKRVNSLPMTGGAPGWAHPGSIKTNKQIFAGGIALPAFTTPGNLLAVADANGDLTTIAPPAATISVGLPSLMPALMSTGAIAENFPRILASSADCTLTSGTPLIMPGPCVPAVAINHINLFLSSTAVAGQTHAWAALLSLSGTILAISADAGSTAWHSGTFVPVTVALASTWTPSSTTQTLLAICIVASTMPTFRGLTDSGTTAFSFSPILQGNSTTTGQTTPPAVSSSLGMPTAAANNLPYCFVS